jgi:hypothetical protein
MACSADAPRAAASSSWWPAKASVVAAYRFTLPMTPPVMEDGQGEAAGHTRGSGGLGVHAPTLLIDEIARVGLDRLVVVRGVHARATVEVLNRVQGGDLLIARCEGEGQPVVEQGETEPHALRNDPLGAPTHGEDQVHQVGAAIARQLGECLEGLRGGLHGSSRLFISIESAPCVPRA